MGAFSVWHWLIVLLIVVLIFGTKKLKNIGQDLGGAVKGFKDGLQDSTATAEEKKSDVAQPQVTAQTATEATQAASNTIDVKAKDSSNG